ncbi:hypothetical protein ANANG_G00069280 [Anguilla anguilla]|uniref:Uncharacterized protein n=1 Tax=Anguilla anguilla TaxID=7936 RepID=A0A9D3S5W8_ANGAN|nr:hypothetical protein ANANG_G00069280 [Anguilla anguilla]
MEFSPIPQIMMASSSRERSGVMVGRLESMMTGLGAPSFATEKGGDPSGAACTVNSRGSGIVGVQEAGLQVPGPGLKMTMEMWR